MKTLTAIALCLAACGPGADRTPKMNATIHAPFNSRIGSPFASNYKTGVKVGFTDDGLLLITATQKGPIKEFSFDGGKWCDVYADARGLHWKDCKTGKAPLSWVSISGDQLQVLNQVIEDIARIEARLKKLEGYAKEQAEILCGRGSVCRFGGDGRIYVEADRAVLPRAVDVERRFGGIEDRLRKLEPPPVLSPMPTVPLGANGEVKDLGCYQYLGNGEGRLYPCAQENSIGGKP